MLDTVILHIPYSQAKNLETWSTTMNRWQMIKRGHGFSIHANNPTKEQKESGYYYPRVSAVTRGRQTTLKIEFSAPKLLFGDNVNELSESQFDELVRTLRDRLKEMGLFVLTNHIKDAKVSSFHPSKNFVLSEGFTASYVISDLHKVGLPRHLDHSKVTFTNDGRSVQYYSAAHSLVFYDKIADLKKQKGRAIDKDQTPQQRTLFDHLPAMKRAPEILRMEARLSKKQKMNAVLAKLGRNKDPTFPDIFSTDLNRAILVDYWNNLVADDHRFILDRSPKPHTLLRRLLRQGIKPKEAIYLIGLHHLGNDAAGITGLRSVLGEHTSARDWPRRKSDLQTISKIHASAYPDRKGWRQQLENDLRAMKPLQIDASDIPTGKIGL